MVSTAQECIVQKLIQDAYRPVIFLIKAFTFSETSCGGRSDQFLQLHYILEGFTVSMGFTVCMKKLYATTITKRDFAAVQDKTRTKLKIGCMKQYLCQVGSESE